MKKSFTILSVTACLFLTAQKPLERVEPMNWWTGMQEPDVQLLVYGKNISESEVSINYPGVTLEKINKVENPNYLFLDLKIGASTTPGKFPILFSQKGKKQLKYEYSLLPKPAGKNIAQGVTSGDFIYLIMPDRFSNGDYNNDIVKGLKQTTIRRDSMYSRHGGDLQGIINHFDYLKDLGVTAIWNTPEIENDMKSASYHGYAATDLYKIDPRYGTNELYKTYVEKAHQKGLKIIKDVVPNHVGSEHWFIKDMPMKDWVNQWPKYTNTNYRFEPAQDPYASKIDYKEQVDGWFVPSMPDMNERNPYVAKYLTQNYLWWIAYSGLDGFRIDTYAYNDLPFMASWQERVKKEYPNFTIFGETLMLLPSNQAYYTKGQKLGQTLDTKLSGVTDEALRIAIMDALNKKPEWYEGVNRLYSMLAQDFLYKDPTKNVVFLDNHDMSRVFSVIGENMEKFKSAISILLTTRGIPQMYYGTEVLMKNFSDPDGLVRSDFKGGWKEDKTSDFTAEGRSAAGNEAFNFVKKLANYRKATPALQTGKLTQFIPQKGVYTYFRYDDQKTVMILFNGNEESQSVDLSRYQEKLQNFTKARNVITDEVIQNLSSLSLNKKQTLVLELIK
ncbi:glycoside hydrolase family 13 protein [Elizabethkingia meningoseptica]|uniref:glycoside hydrolase family 13 protein n=1 Tax=Elizabethkingia meningoseptica TaxID=238 RepID=UPI0023B17FBB|nr:glycoside hydrolase family 13 protein [Elizabethkingia meningoseptica]MDE5467108.1 glycoside hydrolase family 13 protein [Elizabethkingia meningoseptica]MDE5473662.1 glycoside hydrolase family 13 protein [Elizabethkingia meningoseptica]MDE5477095.1 glycoside hydrolase family 13 protein [Elizabethkingia meningoseptica]MDE5484427.1 glycoside hydrolase family 13 protein [Elizabethkingia meningoseptica]MDE5500495.1 glycoside hydrolase family 13 protein [Elizabethkingia meningoseptica]